MTTNLTHQFHAIVSGLVQGVSFRYYTQQTAHKLGVVGWVKNLPDGTVEVMAEGTEPSLQTLAVFLQQGPPHAVVKNVALNWGTPTFHYNQFLITR